MLFIYRLIPAFSDIDVDSAHSGASDPSLKNKERGMYEEFEVAEMGDSGEETKQVGPGPWVDAIYGLGRIAGFSEG